MISKNMTSVSEVLSEIAEKAKLLNCLIINGLVDMIYITPFGTIPEST